MLKKQENNLRIYFINKSICFPDSYSTLPRSTEPRLLVDLSRCGNQQCEKPIICLFQTQSEPHLLCYLKDVISHP